MHVFSFSLAIVKWEQIMKKEKEETSQSGGTKTLIPSAKEGLW